MSKTTMRQRMLQTMDHISSRLPARFLRLPSNDTGTQLSPFLQGLRYLRELDDRRRSHGGSPQAIRAKFRTDMLAMHVGFPVSEVRHLPVPGADTLMLARLYRPAGQDELPVLLVFFHGGGFIMGDLDTHDDACRLLCQTSGMPVLSVAYRLAPEHPFPAAINDAKAAVRWALENKAQFGVKAVAVGGDSAGGTLAAVSAQALVDTDLLAQILIYPGTDLTTERRSHQLFGNGYFLDRTDREVFYEAYLGGNRGHPADPRVSPLLKPEPGRLAPALIVTAGFDMLRDEGEQYAEHLRRAGTKVDLLHFEQLGHAFINLAGVHRDSKAALLTIARQCRVLCQQQLSLGENL